MRFFAAIAIWLVLFSVAYLAGRQDGISALCRQMGYERAQRGDGGVWLCAKTVTFWPGRESWESRK